MGQHQLNRHHHGNTHWARPLLLAVGSLAIFTSLAFAQSTSGHASTAGQITTAHPMAPSHTMAPSAMAPSRPMGVPVGTPIHSGSRFGAVGANPFTSSSAPPPSWELPRTVTPHWELGPNVPVQPNPVQGNHIHHDRGVFGVGYVGLPYYAEPFSFGNAWDWTSPDSEAAEQAAPVAPGRPDYAPQAPYTENPNEQGYGAPRAPYRPEGYPPPQQYSAPQRSAAETSEPDDGLDHPPVTLVFNDGRPPEQVNNYVLTGSSIFVAEHGHQRVIRVADLDLPATVAQNRQAGVDFVLPTTSK